MVPISRLLIFTKGGLLGIIDFRKEKVKFDLEWPEDISINGMALVASIISVLENVNKEVITFEDIMKYASSEAKILFGERGSKILRTPFWLAYTNDIVDYLFIAEYVREDVKQEVIDFLKKLADHLKDVPEEAILVCTEALKFAWEKIVMPNQV